MNVVIQYRDKKNSSGFIKDGRIVLYISSRLSREDRAKHIEVLTRRLTRQAERAEKEAAPDLPRSGVLEDAALEQLAADLNRRFYGFRYQGVTFWTQNSRWGSCNTRTGVIHVSHRLKGGPLELLEYIIIHELCHLKEANHGPRFWALVARGCPDYQRRRKLLHRWGRVEKP